LVDFVPILNVHFSNYYNQVPKLARAHLAIFNLTILAFLNRYLNIPNFEIVLDDQFVLKGTIFSLTEMIQLKFYLTIIKLKSRQNLRSYICRIFHNLAHS
jgi:hypothetical protein